MTASNQPVCRACRCTSGELVLDLGAQPACDYFPKSDDAGPDPVYPLQMWLCSSCGLAQLVADPTVPEEPKGAEPAALVMQAAEAVRQVAAAGLLPVHGRTAEYGSPHGGSWLGLLGDRGLTAVGPGEPAEVVVDCFGLMHAPDQSQALAERVGRVAPGGVLLLQYHSLGTIIRRGQWNALRHGHYAYYSAPALVNMLAATGVSPQAVWLFELYGGTVLMAARRDADGPGNVDGSVSTLLAEDVRLGVQDPAVVGELQCHAEISAAALHDWLVEERDRGSRVIGYGAASRAVALLVRAGVGKALLPAVVDASPAKRGLRVPGTDIPIVSPVELSVHQPDAVLLFLPDLLAEVRAALPEVEASGARWVDIETLGS